MQISATNIPLAKFDLNCLRGTYQLNIIPLTLLLGKSSCNYTFPVTETTLKFNYPEKTAWVSGTIGIIGDNGKVMNTTESVLGLPQRLRWHTRMDWSFFLLVYRIFKTSETMLSNRSNLPLCMPSCNLRSGSIFVSLWKLHSGGQENVWEPLKLGLISG